MPLKWAPDLLTKSVLNTWKQVMSNYWLLIICTNYSSTSYAQCLAHSRNLINIRWLIFYRHLKLNSFITRFITCPVANLLFWLVLGARQKVHGHSLFPCCYLHFRVSPQPTVSLLRLCPHHKGWAPAIHVTQPHSCSWLQQRKTPD